MSNNKDSKFATIGRSNPISIAAPPHTRRRSASVSSSSSGSSNSPVEPHTPVSWNAPRFPNGSPPSSPILSYFLGQSPTKATPTFPFKRPFGVPPLPEEDASLEPPVAAHARRATTTYAGRFTQQQPVPPPPESHQERGASVLRRLSLSSAFARPPNDGFLPPPPPNSAVSPTREKHFSSQPVPVPSPRARKQRAATLGVDCPKPRRAPSPMGERILKGHFDGFN